MVVQVRLSRREQIAGVGPLTTGNELVIPAGRPVHIDLRSIDVMHSFWVPKLAGKVDMIPNRANFLWLQADHPGYYWGQCAEFCGESHAVMRFRVIALGPREFEDWLDNQQTARARASRCRRPAADRPRPNLRRSAEFTQNEIGFVRRLRGLAARCLEGQAISGQGRGSGPDRQGQDALRRPKTCVSCHTIRGSPAAVGVPGPDLTHVGARTDASPAASSTTPRSRCSAGSTIPSAVKPGNKMWVNGYLANHIKLTPDDEVALVAFLQSLK